ncbi:amidohydrolase family protein [Amycolatopsis sp. NPDC058278]|uniref:amidohydrolase family protein n=1 Tax=Amycolatopsis sp. NPDC058278 TaxID=3346417 RepID=UPI0036DA6481
MTVRLDAHHHLWNPTRRRPFLDSPGLAAIRGPYGLPELRDVAERCDIDATILVQTIPDEAETLDFLELAADSAGLVAGVVGWVDLTGPDVPDRLAALRRARGGAQLCGVRHAVQAEPDPNWLDRTDVRRGIAEIGRSGLTYDLLVKPPQWDAALRLARDLPEVDLVVDHAGNPPVAGDLRPWTRWLTALAELPNVYVKLSGLLGLGPVDEVLPVVDHLLSAFTPWRVMAGSDWPVCELSTPAEAVWHIHEAATVGLAAAERAAVFAGTASAFYLSSAGRPR